MASVQLGAFHSAQRILRRAGVEADNKAVRALGMTILAAAAEKTAGGNVERPAFRAYTDSAMTVLENDCSDFCRRAAGFPRQE